jgi:ribosomal protein S12 methylthiotransferase accessory factor
MGTGWPSVHSTAASCLALDDVTDEITLAALERLAAAGVEVLAKLASTDFGLPNVYVVGRRPVTTAVGHRVW